MKIDCEIPYSSLESNDILAVNHKKFSMDLKRQRYPTTTSIQASISNVREDGPNSHALHEWPLLILSADIDVAQATAQSVLSSIPSAPETPM